MSMTISALIADDEPLARIRIADLLKPLPDIEIVGEADNGLQTVHMIQKLAPDLVFLDVQMPQLDGLGVIKKIGAENMPYVIFVTAFDKYLLQAFEVHALDYLLKPFDCDRFLAAVEHATKTIRRSHGRDSFAEEVTRLLHELKSPASRLRKFAVKVGGRLCIIDAGDVDWIESAGNYVMLHVRDERHLVRTTMAQLESQINQEQFVRIHRSTFVNIDRIKEIRQREQGDHIVLLSSGAKLSMSRTYKHNLDQLFQ
jgi:two-component system LytT family response regulator